MRDTKIVAVGRGVAVPPGATVIDGSGKFLTPGMFAPLSALGVVEIDAVGETNDRPSAHKRYGPALDMSDAFNPLSHRIPIARGRRHARHGRAHRPPRRQCAGRPGRGGLAGQHQRLAGQAARGHVRRLRRRRRQPVRHPRQRRAGPARTIRGSARRRPAGPPRARAEPRQPAVAPGHRGHETGDG
ncbi:hypothetical protein LP420_15315 [Massilia sp. B-10]|nr:hypothetical protein LP420_15315 [Massilia sp. B-10]